MGGRRRHSDDDRAKGKRLGAAIAAARVGSNMTQQELASRASLALSTLRRVEAGGTPDPGFFTVLKLARALDIRVDELLTAVQMTNE